jgi:hypothetical protein
MDCNSLITSYFPAEIWKNIANLKIEDKSNLSAVDKYLHQLFNLEVHITKIFFSEIKTLQKHYCEMTLDLIEPYKKDKFKKKVCYVSLKNTENEKVSESIKKPFLVTITPSLSFYDVIGVYKECDVNPKDVKQHIRTITTILQTASRERFNDIETLLPNHITKQVKGNLSLRAEFLRTLEIIKKSDFVIFPVLESAKDYLDLPTGLKNDCVGCIEIRSIIYKRNISVGLITPTHPNKPVYFLSKINSISINSFTNHHFTEMINAVNYFNTLTKKYDDQDINVQISSLFGKEVSDNKKGKTNEVSERKKTKEICVLM